MSNNFSRSRTRRFLYQMLYASTFSKIDNESFRQSFFSWIFYSNLDEDYLKEMFDLIIKNELFLIEIIKTYAPKFEVSNMDLSYVLPIFIWSTEILMFSWEIPIKVSINESVEISKIYWDDSSKKIVNWVLNSVFNDIDILNKKLLDFKNNNKNNEMSFNFFKK